MIWDSKYIETITGDELHSLLSEYSFQVPKVGKCSVVKIDANGTYILCRITKDLFHLRFTNQLR